MFLSETTENGVINNAVVYKFYMRMCKKLGIELCHEAMRGPHSFRCNGITKVTQMTYYSPHSFLETVRLRQNVITIQDYEKGENDIGTMIFHRVNNKNTFYPDRKS